jgi:hypothetical protein
VTAASCQLAAGSLLLLPGWLWSLVALASVVRRAVRVCVRQQGALPKTSDEPSNLDVVGCWLVPRRRPKTKNNDSVIKQTNEGPAKKKSTDPPVN